MQGDFPRKFGPYELLRSLGRGGMAEVYLAQAASQKGDQRLVALKRMHAGVSEDHGAVEMLLAEAQLAMRFDHPNIAAVFELGCHDESYYFLMEYVDGLDVGSMQNMVEAMGTRMDPRAAARVCAKVARGLHYAHTLHDDLGRKLGVVHRDVSPQNVLINRRGEVKLIDFGVAKVATRIQQTMAGIIKGKYAYMSPEQASAEPVDARSDVFSLGICLHELLTGSALFRGPNMASPFAILRAVREDPITLPVSVAPEIGEQLSDICMKALERDVDDRFLSAGEMADELEGWLTTTAPEFGPEALADYVTTVVRSAPKNLVPVATIATPKVALMTGHEFEPSILSVVARSPHEAHTMMPAPIRRASGRAGLPNRPGQGGRRGQGGAPAPRPRIPTLHQQPSVPVTAAVQPPAAANTSALVVATPAPSRTLAPGPAPIEVHPPAAIAVQPTPPPSGRPSRRAVKQFLWVGMFALVFALGWSVIATLKKIGKI